jgi:hypothetical protein
MSKLKGKYRLRVRHYPEGAFVSVWLEKAVSGNGPWSGVLWGEVLPGAAAELAQATGLEIVAEKNGLEGMGPLSVPGCVPVQEQKELFPDATP